MFNKIIYINLDKRSERNNNILIELNIHQLHKFNPIRFPAIDGHEINYNHLSKNIITQNAINDALNKNAGMYSIMTKGGIGCALSHYSIYNMIINNNNSDYYLIIEDDIQFNQNFLNKLNYYLKELPYYDILYLGYHSYKSTDNNNNLIYFDKPKYIFGTYGYIINYKAAKELLKIFPINKQIDSEIYKIFDNIDVYCLKDEFKLINHNFELYGTDIQIREEFTMISKIYN